MARTKRSTCATRTRTASSWPGTAPTISGPATRRDTSRSVAGSWTWKVSSRKAPSRKPEHHRQSRHGDDRHRSEREVRVTDQRLHHQHEQQASEVARHHQEAHRGSLTFRAGVDVRPVEHDGKARQQKKALREEPDSEPDQVVVESDRDERDRGNDERGEQYLAAPIPG